jgi:hypothetical protein
MTFHLSRYFKHMHMANQVVPKLVCIFASEQTVRIWTQN